MEDVAHALERESGLLDRRPYRQELLQGLHGLVGDHLECDELAEREPSIHDHVAAIPEDAERRQRLYEAGDAAYDETDLHVLERDAHVPGHEHLPPVLELRLDGERLHRRHIRDRFDEERLVRTPLTPDRIDLLLDQRDAPDILDDVERHDD